MSKIRKSREVNDEENESLLSENWKCLACLGDDNNPIIKCDECTKWYHMSCVGVSGGENIPHWACTACEVNKQKAASISPTVSPPETTFQVNPLEIQTISQRYHTQTAKTPSVISKAPSVISKSSTTVSKVNQREVQLLECEELYKAQVEYIKNKYKLLLKDNVDIPEEVNESVIVRDKERKLMQGPIDKAIILQQPSHKGYEQCRNKEVCTSISKVQMTQGESKVNSNKNITNQTQKWVKNRQHQDIQMMAKNQITRITEQTADHIVTK